MAARYLDNEAASKVPLVEGGSLSPSNTLHNYHPRLTLVHLIPRINQDMRTSGGPPASE